jgi:hypothetical protein
MPEPLTSRAKMEVLGLLASGMRTGASPRTLVTIDHGQKHVTRVSPASYAQTAQKRSPGLGSWG